MRGFDSRPALVTTAPPIPERSPDAQRVTIPPVEGRPARHLIECLRCLRDDPDRDHGELIADPDLTEARRRMMNHLAQRHDVLPPHPPSPGSP